MPGGSKSGGGLKTKKYVMQMGLHSEDSDTTFKAKDQGIINAGPGKYSKYPLDNAIISSAVKVFKGFGKIRGGSGTSSAPKTTAPVATTKKADMGALKQSFLSSAGPIKPKASASTPKKQTKTVKPAVKSIAAPKAASVSIAAPKPKASTSIPAPKPTVATTPAKTPKVKQSKPNVKKADKNFSKMVKLRTKANIIAGDDSMSDKKKQRKLGRLRKRYDRQAASHKQNRPSIGDAYKVNL
jgi:hypothetical protein